jgi:hypothetical protein
VLKWEAKVKMSFNNPWSEPSSGDATKDQESNYVIEYHATTNFPIFVAQSAKFSPVLPIS